MPLTEEQLAKRRLGVTASEIGAIVGCNPYMKPIDVWERKVYPERDGFNGNIHTERGDLIEPIALEVFGIVKQTGVIPWNATVEHPDEAWMMATPDGRDADSAILVECKSSREVKSELPDHYYCQLQWQMHVTGYRAASLVMIFGDYHPALITEICFDLDAEACFASGVVESETFRIWDVDYDPAFAKSLENIARKFYFEHVLTATPPPPDGSESFDDFLAREKPSTNGELLAAEGELAEVATRYVQVKQAAKEYADEEKQLKQQLLTAAGEYDGITGSFGKLTWKYQNGKESKDWNALAEVAKAVGASESDINGCVRAGNPYRVVRYKRP